MEYGVINAELGKDAVTATDLQRMFDSKKLTHRVYKTGTTTITIPMAGYPSSATVNVLHDLGYVPYAKVWVKLPTYEWMQTPGIAGVYWLATGNVCPAVDVACYSDKITIKGDFPSSAGADLVCDIRYIIFADKMV